MARATKKTDAKPKAKAAPRKRTQKPKDQTPPMPGPTPKFQAHFVKVAASMAALGGTDVEIAEALEISIRTLYRYKYEYPDFKAALETGKEAADLRVEESLYRRAIGYNFDSEEIKVVAGEVHRIAVSKHVPPDTTAGIFWLKNRKPAAWRDTKNIKHDVEEDSPLENFFKSVSGTAIRPKGGA